MESMWGKIDKNEAQKLPKEIVAEQCNYLSQLTNGFVIGRIAKYDLDEPFFGAPLQWSTSDLGISVAKKRDLQELLGDNDTSDFFYEVYLTSKKTPNYKYRLMFISHGIVPYPCTMHIESAIAKEINCLSKVETRNEEAFIATLHKVLSSSRVSSVINNLLRYQKD